MPGAPWKPWLLKPHGTMAAVRKHYRDRTPRCGPCRQAEQRDRCARAHGPNVIPLDSARLSGSGG